MDGGWMDWFKEPRGVKRPPEDNLDSGQRLAKRLSLLTLERNGGLVDSIRAESSSENKRTPTINDAMQLDDTKHKIYIYNLEDELAENDPEEDKLIFLPDIEKRMTKIPQSVLKSPAQSATAPPTNTEVVLYNVPTSLSVPKEQDSVRKAIIETRARARERQAQERRNDATPPPILTNGTTASNNIIFGVTTENMMVNGFGVKPLTKPSRINSNAEGNIFAHPIQNPPTNGYTSIPLDISPHISGTSINSRIFTPPHFPGNESNAKRFMNGFSSTPVDIHREMVVVEDPDAMDIE